ncbi:MAG TPA: cbb3-type cytochrome c oxidase subunit I [Candidatus Angelobacter sp.]|jgi:cytochrome c oxidase subunit 1|nr:cbb3-type cytochrome c oxidase subunit I [Candidatus Angelobacter sp.]
MPNSTIRTTEPRQSFLRRNILSTDHKVIGRQYFFLSLAAVLVGAWLSLLMRIHLVWPHEVIPLLGEIKPENYLGQLTMHGTLMVFFVLSTVPQAGFGTFFLPLQLGARNIAFPRLTAAGFWTALTSFLVLMAAFFVPGGAPGAGWTQYPPLSALASAGPGQGLGTDLWLVSIGLFCLSSLMSAVGFVATTVRHRAPGMTWMRMPLTCWSWFVTSILILLAFGILLAAVILLMLDRHAGTSFFLPGGLLISGKAIAHSGGSPLLWQHLFWFFGHPEVYIAILPAMGVTSHLLSVFARKPVFGYKAMVGATLAIGALGFMVWGHHMFVSGMNPYAGFAFSTLTTAIAVPSAIKTFNWVATLYGGRIRYATPLLFSAGFVSLFITGGLTGPILAQPALDTYLHDTYFVVAHFHLIMAMAGLFAIFSATYFWFPRMFGRMMNEGLGRLHFWITLFGAYAIFVPMHLLGIAGHPRRYSELSGVQYVAAMAPLQKFITLAAIVTIAGQLIFLVNLFWSMRRGLAAEANPWECGTLEWTPASYATNEGLGEWRPQVNHGPYEYNVPGTEKDFVRQDAPAS